MRAKPSSSYHRASSRTWALIRAAYLSGLSAPALAARFGVSEGAVRKRAGREGWTKRAYAQALDASGVGAAVGAGPAAFARPAPAPSSDAWGRLAAALPPPSVSPEALARRSLNEAALALGEGRLDDARKILSATQAIVRLHGTVDLADRDGAEDPFQVEARQSALRRAMFELAIDLFERLREGRPMPPAFDALYADYRRARAAGPPAADDAPAG